MKYSMTLIASILAGGAWGQSEVSIIVSPQATGVERLAGSELAAHLRLLYPDARFTVVDQAARGVRVLVGTKATLPELARYTGPATLHVPESFVVSTGGTKEAPLGVVAGADPRGTLYGVYGLLEKLGFGFYLSYNTHPPARHGPFTFEGWSLIDKPLTRMRMVFNWHNFLSGCSTWDFSDWQKWIIQASRMRFNTIMVHAYGNNPMFSFTHNGTTKPTGYLSTTIRGRDWGTEHVLDVRNIVGGAALFSKPVFGSEAAMVPEAETIRSARLLMQKVFQTAAAHGMGVTFAVDVDTDTSNPQNVIATLPASARFSVGGVQLVNPETPEGKAYYRSQIEQLLGSYPEITQIAVWFRGSRNSPWREVKRGDFPASWQAEFDRALESTPRLRADAEAPSMFAISKIAKVYRDILDETGHRAVTLGAGSWRYDYIRSADAFMPPGVALIPLDYDYAFPSDPARETIRSASNHRPVIPIVWAQHDDREYGARPYLPFTGFASMLRRTNSIGYGIIHWTTRPLDVYFKSLADQIWRASENEQLETTCTRMAEHTFGIGAREIGTRYLLDWIQDSPMFGRETSDRFIDQTLDENPVVDGCIRRLKILERVQGASKSPEASTWVSYFEDLERFMMEFHRVHAAWQRAGEDLKLGKTDEARREWQKVSPERVLRQYAKTISHGGASKGEKGILISMNLRWLPYMVSERQALGLEPLRIRFAPTAPELLAQSPGRNTFEFDSAQHVWQVLGNTETGAEVLPIEVGTCRGGLKVDHPITLSFKLLGGEAIPSGNHQLRIDLGTGDSLEVVAGTAQRVDASKTAVVVAVKNGRLDIELRPSDGMASVCGMVLSTSGPGT